MPSIVRARQTPSPGFQSSSVKGPPASDFLTGGMTDVVLLSHEAS